MKAAIMKKNEEWYRLEDYAKERRPNTICEIHPDDYDRKDLKFIYIISYDVILQLTEVGGKDKLQICSMNDWSEWPSVRIRPLPQNKDVNITLNNR